MGVLSTCFIAGCEEAPSDVDIFPSMYECITARDVCWTVPPFNQADPKKIQGVLRDGHEFECVKQTDETDVAQYKITILDKTNSQISCFDGFQ